MNSVVLSTVTQPMLFVVAALVMALSIGSTGCGSPSGPVGEQGVGELDGSDGEEDIEESSDSDGDGEWIEAPDLLGYDEDLWSEFSSPLGALAASTLPTDDSGLIGRNREWGEMYSARFQVGVGFSLRMFLAGQGATQVELAFRGIEVAFTTIEDGGRMPARVPEEISQGAEPGRQDVASAASFFLGDACHGLLTLQQRPDAQEWISAARQEEVAMKVAQAMEWLETEVEVLREADAAAPNRLLFNARTFIACGFLVESSDLIEVGDEFIHRALALQRPDGVFLEGGGHDTNYQAVALRLALELLVLRESPELLTAVDLAAGWMLSRACGDGRIDSSENTRTCGGGESFLGQQKVLTVTEVFFGFAAYSVVFDDAASQAAAAQVVQWFATSPETSCFEGPDACL